MNPSARPPSTRPVIPVLGMHRSGTSMITRLLNHLGLELGGPLLDAGPDNPQGYWEHTGFIRQNAEMLAALDSNVHGYGSFAELRRTSTLARRLTVTDEKRTEIHRLLAELADSADRAWGCKDPRTVLTWPVWERLLRDFGHVDIRPVVIVRRPAEVVRSLLRRKALTPEFQDTPDDVLRRAGLEVWRAYSLILLSICRRTGCFVGLYERFVTRETAPGELRRLVRFTGLDEQQVAPALDSIRYADSPHDPATLDGETDDDAEALYQRFVRLVDGLPDREDKTPVPAPQQSSASSPEFATGTSPPGEDVVRLALQQKQAGRIDAAVALLKRALSNQPDALAVRVLLAHTLMETGRITESLQVAEPLHSHPRTQAEACNLVGFGRVEQALLNEGLDAFREASRRHPTNNRLRSNILFSSLYADHLSPEHITDLHRRLGAEIETHARTTDATDCPVHHEPDEFDGQECASYAPPTITDPTGARQRLRIGFLSADLRRHPVGYFLRDLLEHRDQDRWHTHCYHTTPGGDDLTTTLQSLADHWHAGGTQTDAELAAQIRSDRLDLLIDLSGHTAANRAGVLARRPAPVQAVYLGYPATTGLPSVDVLIGDSWVTPPEEDQLYTERVLRLDGCFLCFHPHRDAPEPAAPPHKTNGYITFGSFNHLSKLSQTTIRLWARVLNAVPNSRLVIKALALTDPGTREVTARRFEAAGIARDRLDLLPPTVPLARFLDEYRRIDIALDTTPYGGGTTTCAALWMGVPVLTLPGRTFASRMSLSLLMTVGRPDLIADSPEDYVRRAVELAAHPDRLQNDRRILRQQVAESPLCDGRRFAQRFHEAMQGCLIGEPA